MGVFEAVIFVFVAELAELYFQYAPTLFRMIERLYGYYRRSIFMLLAIHTGYMAILFVSAAFDILNWPIVAAIALKTFDIFSKIELIRRVYIRRDMDPALESILSTPVPGWIFLAGPVTYPWLVYVSFGIGN